MEKKIKKDYDYSIEKAREILKSTFFNHSGFDVSFDGDSILFKNETIVHTKTKKPLVLKVDIEVDEIGELTGKFPIKFQNKKGEWITDSNSNGEKIILSCGHPRNNVEKWNQDKQGQMKNLLSGCNMLFYNNWFYCKHTSEYKVIKNKK